MTLASLLLAAAAVAQAPQADTASGEGGGAQADSARIAVQILRPAVLKDGTLVSADADEAPRAQTLRRDGRVTYEFE